MAKRLNKAERDIIEQARQSNRELDRQIRQVRRETQQIRNAHDPEAAELPYRTVYDEVIENGSLADEMGWS